MKWKILYAILFVVSGILSYRYTNKSLIVYEITATERINDSPTVYHNGQVVRTYHENYASTGGAISFGLIAAASLLAFAITIKNDEPKSAEL